MLDELIGRLGHRGDRLAVTYPEILEMQVQAIIEAACQCKKEGIKVLPEIMIPLAGTKSELEDRFLKLCRSAGLPRPKVNTLVEANGATYEVDFLLGRQRLVVEADGWGPHRTRHAFESDRRRDADLLVAGLRVLRVTERQLRREADRVAATLRALRA